MPFMSDQNTLIALFEQLVTMRYQLYNGLFLTLPFANLPKVGAQLPVFSEAACLGLEAGKSPQKIIDAFCKKIEVNLSFEKKMQLLFLMLQFVERQVVLFDALEDNAFSALHAHITAGTLEQLLFRLSQAQRLKEAWQWLQKYKTRIVLTAHPTQFYPVHVLAVI